MELPQQVRSQVQLGNEDNRSNAMGDHTVFRMELFELAIGLVGISIFVGFLKRIHPIFGFISSASALIAVCLVIVTMCWSLISK
jgi:hypothetical protein